MSFDKRKDKVFKPSALGTPYSEEKRPHLAVNFEEITAINLLQYYHGVDKKHPIVYRNTVERLQTGSANVLAVLNNYKPILIISS